MDTPRSRWYRPRRRPRSMAVSSKAATAAEKRRSAKASALPSPTAAAGAADPEASGVSVLPMASPASCRSLCVGVGHLAEAVVAVAPGVLRQVLLVVVLGVVEVPVAGLRQRLDLGRDGAVAGGAQALLVRLARGRGGLGLLRGGGVDQRAVLRPAVVALTHALRGVVQVVYDPNVVSFEELLVPFWEQHDPTQGMGQGNDRGTQYRSLIYTTTPEQAKAAAASRETYQERLRATGHGTITTEIKPLSEAGDGHFYYAEDYHQQYLSKNPWGYCNHGFCQVAYADA